jgi:hypothetical protein
MRSRFPQPKRIMEDSPRADRGLGQLSYIFSVSRLFSSASDCSSAPLSAFMELRSGTSVGQPLLPQIDLRKGSCARMIFRRLIGIVVTIVVGVSASGELAAASSVPEIGKPAVGWNGQYVVGRWTPIVVPITVHEAGTLQLELTAIDPDGNRVGFLSAPVEVAAGARTLEGLVKVGRLDGEIVVRVNQGPELRGFPGRADWLGPPLKPSAHLIVTVGKPRGFDFGPETTGVGKIVKVVSANAGDLPKNPLAYDGVSSLVLAGPFELSAEKSGAVRDWVASGGHLVISLPHELAAARRSLQSLGEWVPVRVAEQPVVIREFGGLESYSGKNVRIPQNTTLSIPGLQLDHGEILAASRADALLVRGPYGSGSVTVLAMDLGSSPLGEWKSLPAFCARLTGVAPSLDGSDKASSKNSQLTSTGITDLATQLHATQEHFEQVNRASPWFVMGLLLALLIIVGPLDYYLVHRVLKRPHLTWITFPLLAAVSAGVAASMAIASNGTSKRMNQLDVISVDVATAQVRGRHFMTLYSPTTSQRSVSVETSPLVAASDFKSTARLAWQGVPESTFGGMLRDSGLEQGAKYQQQPDGTLTQLPLMQWSSRSLVADSLQSGAGLVDCDLHATSTGRLTGTITHRFSSPIEDWMLVYQNRVYRHLTTRDDLQSISLPPKQVWRVEQPSVFQRELRPYLTGIITVATPRFGQSATTDLIHHQTSYDPLSLDPAGVVQILTFHDEVGGERYTGLTNLTLGDEDCSHLLKLGRAILFGRIKQSLMTVEQDGQQLPADRQAAFVRLILPVVRSSELVKELRRVVPET